MEDGGTGGKLRREQKNKTNEAERDRNEEPDLFLESFVASVVKVERTLDEASPCTTL